MEALKQCRNNSFNIKEANARFESMDNCYIGLKYPHFKSITYDNEIINSKDFEGKIVVIHFWATWCGPCTAEIPGLNDIVKKYNNENIIFLAFTPEKKEKIKDYLKKGTPFNFKIITDSKHIIRKKFNNLGFPRTLLCDENGIIKKCFSGGINSKKAPALIREKLISNIDILLKAN